MAQENKKQEGWTERHKSKIDAVTSIGGLVTAILLLLLAYFGYRADQKIDKLQGSFETVTTEIDSLDKSLNSKITELDKSLNSLDLSLNSRITLLDTSLRKELNTIQALQRLHIKGDTVSDIIKEMEPKGGLELAKPKQ